MNPKRAPTAARLSPAADHLTLVAAAPLLGVLVAEDAVVEVPVDVPDAVGVADEAGYVDPASLISNGCDWA